MTLHRFHLFIIVTRNNKNNLGRTLYSVMDKGELFRSVNIVLGENDDYTTPYSVTRICLRYSQNPSLFMNTLIKQLGYKKIFILYEGECLVTKKIPIFNPYDNNSLVKIYFNNHFYWDLRVISLFDQWYFVSDKHHPITHKKVSISKLNIDIMSGKGDDKNTSYTNYLDEACSLIKLGELNRAKDLFIKSKNGNNNREILSRSYLGIAYCLANSGRSISKLEKILKLSYVISNKYILEPLYMLVSYWLKQNNYTKIIKLITKFPESYLITRPKDSLLLNYKTPIYNYLYLYIILQACYYSYNFRIFSDIYTLNRERKLIPYKIHYHIKSMHRDIEKKLHYREKLLDEFNDKNSISRDNISISIKKGNHIVIKSKKTLPDIDFNYNGIRYSTKQKLDHNYGLQIVEKKKHIYNISLVKYDDDKGKDTLINNLPILMFFSELDISALTKFYNKSFNMAFMDFGGKLKSPTTFPTISLDDKIHQYRAIIFNSNGSIYDYYYLIYLFLNGCYVYYSGSNYIYKDIQIIFKDYIYNVTLLPETEIAGILQKNFHYKNTRNLNILATKYMFNYIINDKICNLEEWSDSIGKILINNEVCCRVNSDKIEKLPIISKESISEFLPKISNNNCILIINKGLLETYILDILAYFVNKFKNWDILVTTNKIIQKSYYSIKKIFKSDNPCLIELTDNDDILSQEIILFRNHLNIVQLLNSRDRDIKNIRIVKVI